MRIVIDTRMISPIMHGISRYALNLIKELSKIDNKNKYFLLSNNDYLKDFTKDKKNFSIVNTKVTLYGVMEQLIIPKLLKELKADIFHSPTYSAPVFQPCKVIMTIHDLIHMVFPEHNALVHQYYYKYVVKKAAEKSRRIITVSEFSKNDIHKLLNIPKEKIIVTYNSTDKHYKKNTDELQIKEVKKKYNLKKKYILYIGNHKSHKNLERLVEAFSIVKEKGFEHSLALSGSYNKKLIKSSARFKGDIIFLGGIRNRDLPALYSAADLFVIPSLYEGFGLPALEAMACGTPVIASNAASLPEVIKDAALFFDPYNAKAISKVMIKALSDQSLKKELIQKGLKRSKSFSWEDTANRTLKLYEEVYAEKRIGFNAQKYMSMNTGVGVYTHNLSNMFAHAPKQNQYYIYSSNKMNRENGFNNTNIHLKGSKLTSYNFIRILWEQLILPIYKRNDKVDIFHYPDHTLSLFSKDCTTIITVHDIAFIKFPELFNKSRLIYKNFALKKSFKLADYIIAVSNSTKNDIIDTFPFVKDKIAVIPLGIDKCYRPIDDLSDFIKRTQVPDKFILFLGTLEPRKNIVRLIKAYSILKKEKNITHKLVISGTKGWLYDDIFLEVEKQNLKKDIIFTGLVESKDLAYYYNAADFFVYPSLYEGFGLPPLEAMACGTPVITSNTSSLPEVVGDAGIMIDPLDTQALADKMYILICDESIKQRLRTKGLIHAKKFNWENTLKETIKVYEKMLDLKKQ